MSTHAPNRRPGGAAAAPARSWPKVLLVVASVAVIALSVRSLFQGEGSSAVPARDGQVFEACGQALAEETARLLANRGRVVIIAAQAGPVPSPVHEAYLRGFKEALKAQPGLILTATEAVIPTEAGCPADAYLNVLKKHPTIDAVVSFAGPPVFRGADFKSLPARRPKLVVLGGGREITRSLMSQKLLDASFVPRRHTKSAPAQAQAAREQFDQLYQVVTPTSVAAWFEEGSP